MHLTEFKEGMLAYAPPDMVWAVILSSFLLPSSRSFLPSIQPVWTELYKKRKRQSPKVKRKIAIMKGPAYFFISHKEICPSSVDTAN